MIIIEPVLTNKQLGGLGQGIVAVQPAGENIMEKLRRLALTPATMTPVQQAAAVKRARDERIKAEEAVLRTREPSTPLEVEARERVTTYRAESKFQSNRRRFESQLQLMPVSFKLKVRELIKAHNSYENLPGYAAFAAGRITVKEMRAGLEAQHERLKAYQTGQRTAQRAVRDSERDARDDLMQQEIEAKKRANVAQEFQTRQRIALQAQAARDRAKKKKVEQKAAADDLKARQKALRQVTKDKRKAAFEIEKAAHPFQEGSPPVSEAIKKVAEKMGIGPGNIPLDQYLRLRYAVFLQAKKEYGKFYYYKPSRSSKYWYSIGKGIITATLTKDGYFALPALVKQAVPRPAQPVRATRTANARDPMIQEAIRQALAESGFVSGSQIDIGAFERLVTAKAAALTRTTGKTARPADIQSAVRARVITSLRGAAM